MANKKIVLFPGVGFHTDISQYYKFLTPLQKEFNCETEVFNWKHEWNMPPINDLSSKSIRNFFSEVLLDFQQVVRHATQMDVPIADLYIGHSAGSIIALCQKKPCVLMGSPAALIEGINASEKREYINIANSQQLVLNIVNKADIIAYPLSSSNVENFYISPSIFNPIKLLTAHFSYWDDNKTIKKIKNTIKAWNIFN